MSELAAHAIIAQARKVLGGGAGYVIDAAEIGPLLPDRLAGQPDRLGEVLDLLADTVFVDADVLVLFEVEDPVGD